MNRCNLVAVDKHWKHGPERDILNKLKASIHGFLAGINACMDPQSGPPVPEFFHSLDQGVNTLDDLLREISSSGNEIVEEDITEQIINSICQANLASIDIDDFRKQVQEILKGNEIKKQKKQLPF